MSMSARYRIKEHHRGFTPQKRVLGVWWRMAPTQMTMQAASEIIRQKMKSERPPLERPN